ncbi:MAG: phosphate ABC transporter permease subunit PstC [bacterium]
MQINRKKRKIHLKEWLIERFIFVNGALSIIIILLVFIFLFKDSMQAFTREHTYGWEIAASSPTSEGTSPLAIKHLVGAVPGGKEGEDESDEAAEDYSAVDTGDKVTVAFSLTKPGGGETLVGSDCRAPKRVGEKAEHLFYVYATELYEGNTIKLTWKPDADFDPSDTPFKYKLRLVRAPAGVDYQMPEIDLSKGKPLPAAERSGDPSASNISYEGQIKLPVFRATSDEDRSKGYLFALDAEPRTRAPGWWYNTVSMIFGRHWNPNSDYPQFGMLPLILGSLLVTFGALVIALPLGICTAIFIGEIATRRWREILKPAVELLAAVPSIVIGFIGLLVVVPAVAKMGPYIEFVMNKVFRIELHMDVGLSAFTGAIMLAFMAIPTIVTVAEDAIRAVPKEFREASLALGATQWETIRKAIIPAARSGFVAAAMLGVGRAIGETMAVVMVAGNSPVIPAGLAGFFKPVRTMTATIAQEFGEVVNHSTHYSALFNIGLVLFIMTFVINYASYLFARRGVRGT